VLLAKSILKYLERVADTFLCETTVLGVKLLQKVEAPFLVLEVSQFCCYVLSHIRTRKLLFSSRDRETIRTYLFHPAAHVKYKLNHSEPLKNIQTFQNCLTLLYVLDIQGCWPWDPKFWLKIHHSSRMVDNKTKVQLYNGAVKNLVMRKELL